MSSAFPIRGADLTRDRLTELVRTVHPQVRVSDYAVRGEKVFGRGECSTAGRVELDLAFSGPGAADLKKRVIVKVCRPEIHAEALYRNEVAFYTRLRGELEIETPDCLGGEFDERTGTFGLALEDLRERGATFSNVKTPVSIAQIRSLLDGLAGLHATFWESPRFETDLSWVQPHTAGELYEFFNHPARVPALIAREIDTQQFKAEMVQAVGRSAEGLYREFRKLQRHQATLPQTLCHGDTHIGNTYLLPDGRGGLVDWQLMARGHCLHDVTYLLMTGLSVADRRRHERDLMAYYLLQLSARGVAEVPTLDEAWLEVRRAVVWGVYIGWLTTPIENYGWDICVCNHVRLMTAYHDLQTSAAIAELPEVDPF